MRRCAGPEPDRAVFYPDDERFPRDRDEHVLHREVDRSVGGPARASASDAHPTAGAVRG